MIEKSEDVPLYCFPEYFWSVVPAEYGSAGTFLQIFSFMKYYLAQDFCKRGGLSPCSIY